MSTQQTALKSKQKEQITSQAVGLFNTVFNDWVIVENSKNCVPKSDANGNGREMVPDDLKVTNVTKIGKGGHLSPPATRDYWKLGVNVESYNTEWQDSGSDWLGFLLHELSHAAVMNHCPAFWEVYADAINTAAEQQEVVEEIINSSVRMDRVREFACRSIVGADGVTDTSKQVDAFAEAIDYDPEYVNKFDTRIHISEEAINKSERVIPHTELSVSDHRRDWVLHHELDKLSPHGFRCGEVVAIKRPIVVNAKLEVAEAYETRADLIQRIAGANPKYIFGPSVDVPVVIE